VTAGRTGGTRLRYLIDYHPMAKCHGEVLGENLSSLVAPGSVAEERMREERDADPAGFIARRVLAAEGGRAVGFKVLYRQLTDEWPVVFDAIVADRTVRVVHLVRRNLVKRFVSEFLVGTKVVMHRYFHHEQPPMPVTAVIPVERMVADLHRVEAEVQAMREAFKEHPLHEIAYEETIDDAGNAMHELLRFLGLPPARLWSPTRKVLPDRLSEVVGNLDEVASALRGTPYEPMLAEDA
jgi:hypothetical protein